MLTDYKPPSPASYKVRTLIATCIMTDVKSWAYTTHNQLWFHLGRDFPEHFFYAMPPTRMSIDRFRNEAAKVALQMECDYLFFLDDDVLVQPATYRRLYEALDKDLCEVVMAETYIRGYPFEPMFFKSTTDDGKPGLAHFRDYKKFVRKDGRVECGAIGFSCALIKVDLLRKMEPPYFITSANQTEDVYFCMKAKRELGEGNVRILVDTRVPTGHLLDPEPIHKANRKFLLKYYEGYYNFKDKKQSKDRGGEYAKAIKAQSRVRNK